MSIGSRIKEARIDKKMTQEDLANKLGVTKGAIANYENGVSIPKSELLLKLFVILEWRRESKYIFFKHKSIDLLIFVHKVKAKTLYKVY